MRDAVELNLYGLIDLGMCVPVEICPDRRVSIEVTLAVACNEPSSFT